MSSQHLSVNASAAAGLLRSICGALETRRIQSTVYRRPWEMMVLSRVIWRACVGNYRPRMGDVSHAGTHHGPWILGVWLRESHTQMRSAESAQFGPPTPQVHGRAKCIVRSLLRDQAPDHPQMLPSEDVAAVSISLLCPRKGAIYPKMSDPLARAGHRRLHGTRQLAERQYGSPITIGFKGWFVAVREMVGLPVGMPDGMLVTLS
jgi:hypothetical protein